MNPKEIKYLVQKQCRIKNLESKCRKQDYAFTRYIFFRLCKDFIPDVRLREIGSCIDRDHSTVLHGIKKFDELYDQKVFEDYREHYHTLTLLLKRKQIRELKYNKKIDDLEQYYRVRFLKLVEKQTSYRIALQRKLKRYQKSKVLDQIYGLPEDDFKAFESLVRNYFKKQNAA